MQVNMTPKVILDLKGLIQHSFFGATDKEHGTVMANGKTINSPGFGVQAFYQRYLAEILKNTAPINIIGVWDDGREYRKRLLSSYKQHRDEAKSKEDPRLDEALQATYKGVRELLASLGASQVKVAYTEADDIIALLCQRLPCNKIVYTNDSDILQLQTDTAEIEYADGLGAEGAWHVDVIVRGESYPEEYQGCPIKLIAFNKATVGDTSDGYIGVRGFGEESFNSLVANYGVEGVLRIQQQLVEGNPHKVAKIAEKFDDKALARLCNAEGYQQFRLAWTLAQLHPEIIDTVIDSEIRSLKWYRRLPSYERAAAALNPLGVGYIADELARFYPTQTLVTADNFVKAREFMGKQLLLQREAFVSVDYESYDSLRNPNFQEAKSSASGDYVDVLSQVPTGLSVNFGKNLQHTLYFSFNHAETDNIDIEHLPGLLRQLLNLPGKKLVAHNAEFEHTLSLVNFQLPLAPLIDSQAMLAYVDENYIEEGENGLKPASKRLFNYTQTTYEEVLAGRQDMRAVTGEEVLQYGCDDAFVTGHLAHWSDMVLALENQRDFFYENEPYVIAPLADRLIAGIPIDFDVLYTLRDADRKVIDENTASMNKTLAENCQNENVEAANALFEMERDYYTAKHTEDFNKKQEAFESGQSKEAPQHDYVAAKMSRIKNKMIELSKFTPPEMVAPEWEFIPTAAKFKEVLKCIEASEAWYENFPKSFTPGTVSKWIRNVQIVVGEGLSRNEKAFAETLGLAAPELKERAGDNYAKLKKRCERIVTSMMEPVQSGTDLNLGSPDQVKGLLYCMMGLPVRVRSKVQNGSWRQINGFDGGPATDIKAIEMAIAYDANEDGDWRYAVLKSVKAIRKAEKRFEMYYDKYHLWVHPRDGRIHPGIRNNGTMTRRPSGSNPNILQVSKVKAEGDVPIRSAFLPLQPGHVFVDPDFDGQELRIMASESKDEVLTDAYIGPVKKDIHSLTAAAIAAVLLPRIDQQLAVELATMQMFCENGELGFIGVEPMFFMKNRKGDSKFAQAFTTIRDKYAKPANFLIIYGGGGQTLARNIGCPVELAYGIMDTVFKAYPGIRPWQENVSEFARTHGYVLTAYGTRKHIVKDIFSSDDGKRRRVERQAVNQTIQGCAADMLKQVIRTCGAQHIFKDFNATLVAPIYDEVLFSVPAEVAVEFSQQLMQIMRVTPPGHVIPMEPALNIALDNFNDGEEFGTKPDWDKVAAHVATKVPSKSRFYLPTWFKEAA